MGDLFSILSYIKQVISAGIANAVSPPFRFLAYFVQFKAMSGVRDCLLQSLNQMQSTRRVHHTRDLAGLQREGRLLELLLHVTPAEVSQIPPLTGTAAVGLGDGQGAEGDLAAPDALLVALDDPLGLVLAAGDV